jgi:hypothetical protein
MTLNIVQIFEYHATVLKLSGEIATHFEKIVACSDGVVCFIFHFIFQSIDLLKTTEKEIITIYSLNKRLQSFFEMTNEEMTEHDLYVITSMLAMLRYSNSPGKLQPILRR